MSVLTLTGIAAHAPFMGNATPTAERAATISAPVPAALIAAHTAFLSNAGEDAGLFPHPFTGGQDRGYGYAYNALKEGGRFHLVDSPAEADVVLELSLNAPTGSLSGNKVAGVADPLPTFKLTVYDRASHYILWTVMQTIDPAALQKTHDRNFDVALDLLLKQLMTAAGPAH
jgi:hypothetical protein